MAPYQHTLGPLPHLQQWSGPHSATSLTLVFRKVEETLVWRVDDAESYPLDGFTFEITETSVPVCEFVVADGTDPTVYKVVTVFVSHFAHP